MGDPLSVSAGVRGGGDDLLFFFPGRGSFHENQQRHHLFLLRLFVPGYDGMAAQEKHALFQRFQYLVRKAAHFTEFAMLGASLRLLFHALLLKRPALWAWIVGTLYACTDEMHQLLTDARSARVQDVCIDSAGVLTAALFITLLLYARRKRKETGKQ